MSAGIVQATTPATPLAAGVPPDAADCLVAHVLTPPSLRWVGGEPLAARLLHAERDAALA
ncbi:MAG: hypothetical protein HOQ37_17180, partial [Cupriavidus sp.]|nr:hypothetical protein [Cupriavidus sp.]